MNFTFEPTSAQLKVFSAVCSNLVAGWFITLFATRDLWVLTGNVLGVIVSLYLAIKSEELLEDLL